MQPRAAHALCVLGLAVLSAACGDFVPDRMAAKIHPRELTGTTGNRFAVAAAAETEPLDFDGDNADDIAVWVDPVDPAASLILAAVKSESGGILVYDLAGRRVQAVRGKSIDNIDIRYGFPLRGGRVDIVAGSNRTDQTVAVIEISAAGELTLLTQRPEGIRVDFGDDRSNEIGVYGLCLYRSTRSGRYYAFVTCKTGFVAQIELHESSTTPGEVTGTLVRSFDVSPGEGDGTGNTFYIEACVADDLQGRLYVAEEDVGIWRYGAEPDDTSERVLVDRTGRAGHLAAGGDVEGLAIYQAPAGEGYLIASSQGDNSFNVYGRTGDNRFQAKFEIAAGAVTDPVTDTDGIEVVGFGLGGEFGSGLFVVQDDQNEDSEVVSRQNFKLLRWSDIANGSDPPLMIRTDVDPRGPPAP